jgi:very-short-patch-repair endonuclease
MNPINLKLIETTFGKYHQSIFEIDQDKYLINGKEFLIKKTTSNLSAYLNSINISLIDVLQKDIDNICKECGKKTKTLFYRKKLRVYHFCSVKCQKKYKNDNISNICPICETQFLNSEKKRNFFGTCGDKECIKAYKKNRGKNIKDHHWSLGNKSDDIILKRTKTRILNDKKFNRKYHAWNKGLTGIYSKESIDKMKNAALKQLEYHKFKKTYIEKKIENFLISENIKHTYSFILNQRQYDFYLPDSKLLIEADGDYWHGNPSIYENLTERQLIKQKDDKIKDRIAIENGYKILRFWEFDINNNFDLIKNKINDFHGKNI